MILAEPVVGRALAVRGLDLDELRERLAARLSARPTVGGYRDGAPSVALSPALERVLDRLNDDASDTPTVLDALLLEPWIASLIVGLREGRLASYAVERAIALAIVHGHAEVHAEHVLACMLDHPVFENAARLAGGDPANLLQLLASNLAAKDRVPDLDARRRPRLAPALHRLFNPKDSVRRFLVLLSRAEATSSLFDALGGDPYTRIYALTHDAPPPRATAPRSSGDIVNVFGHADPVTAYWEIVATLVTAFELAHVEATELANVIVTTGHGLITILPISEANLRCAAARTYLERQRLPFRITQHLR